MEDTRYNEPKKFRVLYNQDGTNLFYFVREPINPGLMC